MDDFVNNIFGKNKLEKILKGDFFLYLMTEKWIMHEKIFFLLEKYITDS